MLFFGTYYNFGPCKSQVTLFKREPLFSIQFRQQTIRSDIIDGTLGQFLVGTFYFQRDVPMCELVADWPDVITGPIMNKLRSHL